jgi:excisionase family DNA binding protein
MRITKHGADDQGRLHRLLSLDDAAFYVGLSYWGLRGMLHNGDLPYVRAGRRLLVDRQDLDRWIEAHKTKEEPF